MSDTPPGYPGQPQQPVSPDGRWWWDGSQWRPNAANPFEPGAPDLDNARGPASLAEGVRFTPEPPGVPHPYVPPRLPDPDDAGRRGASALDDLPMTLGSQPRSWWTPRRFVLLLAGVAVAILLGIGLLFWLSIDAFQKQRDDGVPEPAPDVTMADTGTLPN